MSLDINELLEENQRLSTEGLAFLDNFVKMPEGNGVVTIRLLPPAVVGMFDRKKSPFYQATRIHRLNNRSYHCSKVLSGSRWEGECPICRYYNWLWAESDKKSQEEATSLQSQARAIKPIERYYYNCIVRFVINPSTQEMQKNVGPKILSIGKTLHKMIIRAIVGDKSIQLDPLGDITDPKTGRDFKIVKTIRQSGKEAYPNYSDSTFAGPSPLGEPDEVKKWLASLHDLTSLRTVLGPEELKKQLKIHLGLIPDDAQSATNFDPTEFQKGAAVEESVVVVSEEVEVAPRLPVVAVEVEGGESTRSLAADDFLEELKRIED